ncbi:lipopolysaccharide assembly protein LapA domain-containing protein [Thermodesulfobacteriota bacterium]
MWIYFRAVIIAIILLFFITFGIKNSQTVQLTYYFNIVNISMPLYGIVYIAIFIGIIIGMGVGVNRRFKLRKKIRNMEREIKDLKNDLVPDDEGTEGDEDDVEDRS